LPNKIAICEKQTLIFSAQKCPIYMLHFTLKKAGFYHPFIYFEFKIKYGIFFHETHGKFYII